MSTEWTDALGELNEAVEKFTTGDSSGYQQLWSHRDDVCLMGAYGSIITGWANVARRITWAADHFAHWTPRCEVRDITQTVHGDLAILIRQETVTDLTPGSCQQVQHRRLTLALRREEGHWRIFHQHSDPLVADAS
jgi:ketosteroid isomerase-like protein